MTLNQIFKRLENICTSHKMVRNFYKGLASDFLTGHTTLYPSAFLEDSGGEITIGPGGQATLNYHLSLVDLVNVSEDTNENERDVHSDMLSIMLDIVAQINAPQWGDWVLSANNQIQLFVEENSDMYAGVSMDFSIRIPFKQNICAIPSTLDFETSNNEDMKLYDLIYTATGEEGDQLNAGPGGTITELLGKKLVLNAREGNVMVKVSNLPQSGEEYTWNGTVIGFDQPIIAGARFLFLYRNY